MSFTEGGDGPGFSDASAAFVGRARDPAKIGADYIVTRRLTDALLATGDVRREEVERALRDRRLRQVTGDMLLSSPIAARRKVDIRRTDERTVIAGPWLSHVQEVGPAGLLARDFAPALARRAATRRPGERSFRIGAASWQRIMFGALALAVLVGAIAAPTLLAQTTLATGFAVVAMNAVLWIAACLASRGAHRAPEQATPPPELPKISLLVPLYREPETLPLLINALTALKYPRKALEVKIVLEEDDDVTRLALAGLALPSHFEVLTAPDGAPRTKPRALNYALDFTTGDIIGIYDAEDRPAADQLLDIAAVFAASGPATACVQARLSYYNAKENWLTRCFELEYAAWFDVMLPGLLRLGLPLPLGGTSLFLRRDALEAVGGWDSHNVTEDADLGMALARAGYETALSVSITEEEASSRTLAWIKQRSRWLKGYLATWSTHMRTPGALIADLGWRRFAGFNAVLLGAVLGYLLMLPLWGLAGFAFLGWFGDDLAGNLQRILYVGALALPALGIASALGLSRRKRLEFAGWIVTAPVYWLLGAAAAYLAVWELLFAPTKWRKTQHGVGEIASLMRESSNSSQNAAPFVGPGDRK